MAIWKAIKGYNSAYWVSDEGQVISMNYNRTGKTKILKARKNRDGYLYVVLCKDGKKKTCCIHRLVAEAFIPNPDNLPCVNHKNEEDKTDNRAEALEWCSYKYNNNYGTRNQRIAEKHSKPVLQYDLQGNFIKEWCSGKEVERQTGFDRRQISDCLRGKQKSSKGYIWQYKEERAA